MPFNAFAAFQPGNNFLNWFIITPAETKQCMGEYMLKKIVSSSLIVIFCGVWIYLDHLNKLQIKEAQELRQAMEQARIQALARAKAAAEVKAKFESDDHGRPHHLQSNC